MFRDQANAKNASDSCDVSDSWNDEDHGLLSRRAFVKDACLLTIGGACLGNAAICLAHPNVSPGLLGQRAPLPRARGHIARVSDEVSTCASCGLCSMACATVHRGAASSLLSSIWLHRKPFACVYDSITCKQCDSPECFDACSSVGGGAMFIHPRTGARAIDPAKCLGCRACMEACVFSPPRIGFDVASHTAFKCDLCSDRPEGPACVALCPHQALILTREPRA